MKIINENNLPHFLLDHGLLENEELFSETYTSYMIPSRNANYAVTGIKHPLLIKQIRTEDTEKKESLKTEAFVYKAIHDHRSFYPLKEHVPAFKYYDKHRHTLVISWLNDSIDLSKKFTYDKGFQLSVADKIADVFYKVQSIKPGPTTLTEEQLNFNSTIPWIFNAENEKIQYFNTKNEADAQVIKLVQTTEYARMIGDVRKLWKTDTLIHGDIKWANILFSKDDSTCYLIDWEMADWGDPLWDVAGLVQSFLSNWVFSEKKPVGNIDNMIPFLNRFLSVYSSKCGLSSQADNKIVQFAGIRIIQTCLESNHNSNSMAVSTAKLLQLGYNMLKMPEAIKNELLGR